MLQAVLVCLYVLANIARIVTVAKVTIRTSTSESSVHQKQSRYPWASWCWWRSRLIKNKDTNNTKQAKWIPELNLNLKMFTLTFHLSENEFPKEAIGLQLHTDILTELQQLVPSWLMSGKNSGQVSSQDSSCLTSRIMACHIIQSSWTKIVKCSSLQAIENTDF